jgi:hypothetical protein
VDGGPGSAKAGELAQEGGLLVAEYIGAVQRINARYCRREKLSRGKCPRPIAGQSTMGAIALRGGRVRAVPRPVEHQSVPSAGYGRQA